MAKPIITIDDFSQGIRSDPTKNLGMQILYACDPYKDPGVLRVANKTEQGGIDTALTTNSEYIEDFELYVYGNAIGQVNLHGIGSNTGIYRLDPTDDTWKRDHTVASLGSNLQVFGTSLYYVNGTQLGRLNGDPTVGGNWNDSYQTLPFPIAIEDPAPMIVFASSLYVGNNRYISKLEAGEIVWEPTALTLPSNFLIKEMIEWNDYIVISVSKKHRVLANTIENQGAVLFWDGVSEFPQTIVETDGFLTGLINYNNRLTGFSKGRMFIYNGSDFEIQRKIPGIHNTTDNKPSMVTKTVLYRENILINLEPPQVSSGSTETKGGVWEFGRHDINYPFALTHSFEPRTGEYGQNDLLQMGGLFVFPSNYENIHSNWRPLGDEAKILFSYYDAENATYNVDAVVIDEGYAGSSYALTVPFETSDRDSGRLIKGVKLEFSEELDISQAANSVTVKYRVDEDIDYDDDTTSWTTLGIIDNDPNGNDNMKEILYGIYEKAFKIQFRFDLVANGSARDQTLGITRIHIY